MQTKLETQAEAIIYFMQEMDINMIDLILDEKLTYQDFPKSKFIGLLDNAFNNLRNKGNTKLIANSGYCDSNVCPNQCNYGHSFMGNLSQHKLDIIFDVKNGKVMDLYECYDFKLLDKNTDFKSFDQILIDWKKNPLMNEDGSTDIF